MKPLSEPLAQRLSKTGTDPGTNGTAGTPGATAPPRAAPRLRRLRGLRGLRDDTGAATAEYAVATMAAVGFAGLLIVILRGDEVRGILTDLVRNALSVG
ncbi:DUF4244 domain-containing protein [Cryobacterium cryoconiti]|uniref:DUF4244 domain-containing protein n=1 Tax=Cryobacterium cryoconiti TaxID=1259239 RepID=A0A4Y8JWD4_9MICO|nr:DUF4244 domain-containing protein [Cryobacterium cryoconiti]